MNTMPLWKQCRILANPVRLKVLAHLDQHPHQYVRSIGDQFGMAEDVASKNLQLMASAGFLESERKGRYLFYSLQKPNELLRPVLVEVRKAGENVDPVIQTLTALTHERRVAMVAVLTKGSLDLDVLCRQTRISGMAAARHLDKLVRRGWVSVSDDQCRLLPPGDVLGRALVELAKNSLTLAQV
jgi:DNA-binding transcriptional ArsR family regulator